MEAAGAAASVTFDCKHCDMKFTSLQGLGGHQNAHRVEHAVAKEFRKLHHSTQLQQQQLLCRSTGLCIFCLKSRPLQLCFDSSSVVEKIRKKARIQSRKQQLIEERFRAYSSSNVASIGRINHGVFEATVTEKRALDAELDGPKEMLNLDLKL
ncbi:uncharacterized protein A4U43_C03F19900 [Asparagus officinalis]|uniref:C2H2-type domain-containing protein n=1 Tax=Asparagus officinalis TaxID=4686 RepID=A0A5P1FBH4_ASPOF|nr:uncharacterized protein A4U43_C03F19900 [Asparagus officinalis]